MEVSGFKKHPFLLVSYLIFQPVKNDKHPYPPNELIVIHFTPTVYFIGIYVAYSIATVHNIGGSIQLL